MRNHSIIIICHKARFGCSFNGGGGGCHHIGKLHVWFGSVSNVRCSSEQEYRVSEAVLNTRVSMVHSWLTECWIFLFEKVEAALRHMVHCKTFNSIYSVMIPLNNSLTHSHVWTQRSHLIGIPTVCEWEWFDSLTVFGSLQSYVSYSSPGPMTSTPPFPPWSSH